MERPDNTVFLRHILDATDKIEGYLARTNTNDFRQNSLIQDGIIRQLEIIGEAVRKITPEFRVKHSHIPWIDIAGTRDKLIHGYAQVDLDAVWKMATEDVPILKQQILQILSS